MKYVLDTSAALPAVLNEPLSPESRKLFDEFKRGIHELIAPDTFVVEAAHALTRAERQKILRVGDAEILLADLLRHPLNSSPSSS